MTSRCQWPSCGVVPVTGREQALDKGDAGAAAVTYQQLT